VNCLGCGTVLDVRLVELGEKIHPSCMAFFPEENDPLAETLKAELTKIIVWADSNSPRSLQLEPGPSELGSPCDRQLAYRLMATPDVNIHWDRWPAIVGSAIHVRLDEDIQRWVAETGDTRWRPEVRVNVDEFLHGHSDVYRDGVVIDHKTASDDIMRKVREDLVKYKPGYIVQVMLYGLGYQNQGLPVTDVALAFYPRGGRLRDMYVWTAPYDRSIAEAALTRMYDIAARALELDLIEHPHRFEQIDATPTNDCGFCPWYDPNKQLDTGADNLGCPGR
jgi:hypothetical protein